MITRCRCLLVWTAATAAALATARWALAAVGPAARFDQLVASVAGVALTACAVWAWTVCTVVVAQAAHRPGRAPRRTVGVPAWASRAVLAACGLAVLSAGPAAHASYDVHHHPDRVPAASLDGLPFPDRATGPAHAAHPAHPVPARASAAARTVEVVPGDNLWSIAASLLPPGAPDTEVAAVTAALVDLNRDAVGPDPDLIHPGLRLRTPGS
ncbi:LysM peptidoglycan-binding domain-containing protein [Nocardioides rubriscoriae]|uniref:LysM peptidoglycan-binding domain-containing protein n=1 Tax=Nocardioides rubriscoriae TaxID=642762 RepID=UPI0011E06C00|nr:LysM domain-containing protein [Nocardioides rubriscoriae]